MDAILNPECLWRGEPAFNGATLTARIGEDDLLIERFIKDRSWDIVSLHGDNQVEWMLAHRRASQKLLKHLAPLKAVEIALSKARSSDLATELGIPVLPTRTCETREEAERCAAELAGSEGEVVLRGEGSSAGSAVRSLRAGDKLSAADWESLTHASPSVLVQRRIRGPRLMATVLYEKGVERVSVIHEKLCTWPEGFGVTALGRTRKEALVHDYTRRLFEQLKWHGPANIEFRQSKSDGKWYFIEINPRVGASIGIQNRAGLDYVSSWAQVANGHGDELGSSQDYEDGVSYWWTVPMLAFVLRHPQYVPWRELLGSLKDGSDWAVMDAASRLRAVRNGIWCARNP